MKYRREIDGLRAVAVLPVIFFHAGIPMFSGGFVGVDVFFVISGFLITTIISSELDAGTFSIARFYERRARRILPALFIVMAATLPFAWFWMTPVDLKGFSQSLAAVPLFCSNILFYATSGYFDTASEIKPLLHTWSLAVEEQYYVLFPPLLALVWRYARRWATIALALAALVSLAAAQHFVRTHPSFTFYMLPTRGFEILLGALISSKGPWRTTGEGRVADALRSALAAAGLVLIIGAVVFFDKSTPSPSLFSLIPTCGAALILLYAREDNFTGRLLGTPMLVGVGLISYSLYLWHQPLLAFARIRYAYELSYAASAVVILDALILSYLSWKYVEHPFRDRRVISLRVIAGSALALTLAFVSIGVLGWRENGFPQRFKIAPDLLAEQSPLTNIARIDNGWCFYSIDTIKTLRVGADGTKCAVGARTGASHVGALFGDSFAGSYEPFWDQLGRDGGLKIISITTNWCYPSFTEDTFAPVSSKAYPQCLFDRKYLRDHLRNFDFVIIGGMWSEVLKRKKLDQVLDGLDVLSKNVKTVIVMPSPKQYDHSPFVEYRRHLMFGDRFDIAAIWSKDDAYARDANAILKRAASKYRNVVFLDRDLLFGGGELTAAGLPYSADGTHVSISGAEAIAPSFSRSPAFASLLRRIDAGEGGEHPVARPGERSP